MKNLTTIGDYIRFALSLFSKHNLYYGHGTDNAYDEACYLVLGLLNLPFDLENNFLNCQLTLSERKLIQNAINKRVFMRIPTAYLVGNINFCDLNFKIDKRALIPRSPISELISEQFRPWLTFMPTKILDMCTGSGCIGIACAYNFPDSSVVLADISSCALNLAQQNIKLHNLEHQVTTLKSDLFINLVKQKFDLIVCNPPYVDVNDLASMPAEYSHEPNLGLTGGKDGLNLVRKILNESHNYLNANGILIVEVGNSAEHLIKQYPQIDFMWLEFANGGSGVFLLTYEQCVKYHHLFN